MANELGEFAHASPIPAFPGQVIRGGVIRFEPTVGTVQGKPYLHVNSAHQSFGIIPESVKISAWGDLEFMLDIGMPVVSTWVSPDETLVVNGIAGGLSGGAAQCIVRFRLASQPLGDKLDLNNPVHYAKIAGSTSNVWVGVVSYWAGE